MKMQQDERSVRLKKLADIKERGMEPYPSISRRTHSVGEVIENFDHYAKSGAEVTLAGRILSIREHGGSSFVDLFDGTGRIQLYFKKDLIKKSVEERADLSYQDFLDFTGTGDFIEGEGELTVTQKGEKTLFVKSWRLLSKALRPIPRAWYGIKDEEKRYRRRYLEMLLHHPLRELFQRKALFWQSMREFLISEGFVEVFTPVLETTTGGADARPFITHHNALDMDVYLRISAGELWQKRLMIAGFPKTFEMGRIFRNEGISPEHLQDYVQMEYYVAYADYEQGMELTERLIKHVVQKTWGTLQFTINDTNVDLSFKWDRVQFVDEMKRQTGIEVLSVGKEVLKRKLDEFGIPYEDIQQKGRLVDLLWKHCRKQIVGPVYITHIPVYLSPLAKRSEEDTRVTERFQLVLAGSELCNGYSELNDPVDQAERFKEQRELREAGDEEAQMYDEDFIEALEYGMPPVCGLGISERLFAFLEGKSVRECTMFPLLRPQHVSPPRINQTMEQEIKNIGITRDEALKLLHKHIKNPNLIKHHLAVEIQMRALAEYFKKNGFPYINPDAWAMTGLLHDMDWEETENDFKKHSLVTADILNKLGVHPAIVEAIRVHNHVHGIEPKTLMEKVLYCAEELTGLVVAVALVQPEKKLASVDVPSVVKKFKDKAFARGVNREIILKCKEFLGMELDELIALTLRAMQGIAGELGL